MKLDLYLEKIQCGETSTMTFNVDSPQGKKKKKVLRTQYPNEQSHMDIIQKRLMIDFDGVIHDYVDGWNDGKITGSIILGAVETIKALSEEFEIVIFTTRAAPSEDGNQIKGEQIKAVQDWLDKQGVHYDKVTGEKLGAFAYIDDKAIRFEGNWNYVLTKINEIHNTQEGSNTV